MITVFTPTYNRAHLLERLYESLRRQNCKDFEWIVVDDFSTDDTMSLLKVFAEERGFPVRFYRQEKNGGKHRAINKGVKMACGELFFIVDSDDILPPDSIDVIIQNSRDIIKCDDMAGVSGTKAYLDGIRVGGHQLPFEEVICSPMDVRYKWKVKGDLAEVWKTDLLRKFPFPEFDGERFLEECVVWFRIGEHYKLKFFNRVIYCCEYLEGGLTNNIRRIHRQSPLGSKLYCMEMIRNKHISIWGRIKAMVNYYRYTISYKGETPEELKPYWWMYVWYPFGYFFYLMDCR